VGYHDSFSRPAPANPQDQTLRIVLSTGSVPSDVARSFLLRSHVRLRRRGSQGRNTSGALHSDMKAVNDLLKRGAESFDGRRCPSDASRDDSRLFAGATSEDRHLALLAADFFGHAEIVRLLLDGGRSTGYNRWEAIPTRRPLHQSSGRGHDD